MNGVIFSRKKWQLVFDIQLVTTLIVSIFELALRNQPAADKFGQIFFLILIICLNFYVQFNKNKSKVNFEITRWINLLILSGAFVDIWLRVGNYLLTNFRQFEILWVLLLWMIYLFLLLPLAVLYAGTLKNWILRIIAVFCLDIQYGPDSGLLVSRNLRWMHSITTQGVVSAFALLIMACFLGYAWGYRFNPNLKFLKSKNFQISVLIILLFFVTLDLFYNEFISTEKQIWTAFFGFSVDIQSKYLTIPSFTSALEPGILEETERYLNIVILLAGFNHFPKLRIPIAVYGSSVIFGLGHLGNLGCNGETLAATIAQVFGVMGSAFIWAVLYLYSGKLWLPMLYHFLMDYLSNIQSGWNSAGWVFEGSASEYIFEILIIGVPLGVSIWMMFGKRRLVLEENADRLLNLNNEFNKIEKNAY